MLPRLHLFRCFSSRIEVDAAGGKRNSPTRGHPRACPEDPGRSILRGWRSTRPGQLLDPASTRRASCPGATRVTPLLPRGGLGPRDKPEDDICGTVAATQTALIGEKRTAHRWCQTPQGLTNAAGEPRLWRAGISFPVHNVCRRRMTRGAECALVRVPRRCGGGSGTVVVKEPRIAVRKPLRAGRQTSGAPVHGARMF